MRQIKVKTISQQIEILGDEAKHLIYSLRSKVGERVTVIDKIGNRALIELAEFSKDAVTGKLLEMLPTKLNESITLAVAIPKRGLEDIVRQATEIGVLAIQPIITARTVSKPSVSKQERWQRIAKEAAEQSGALEPVIKPIMQLKEFIQCKNNQLIFCNETEQQKKISEIKLSDKVTIIIGSEGGFTKSEITLLEEAGAISVTLGENILRVDTAAIFALTSIKLMMNYKGLGD